MLQETREWFRDRLLRLLRTEAYRPGVFKLASGKMSDFYIDCRRVVLTAEGHWLVGMLLFDAVEELGSARTVAGMALGGCPLASSVSLVSCLQDKLTNALYVRKEAKDHGTGKRIEGEAPAGATVVLLEDVLTSGGSAMKGVDILRGAGFVVHDVIALVDRLEGAKEALDGISVKARALFTRDDFMKAEHP